MLNRSTLRIAPGRPPVKGELRGFARARGPGLKKFQKSVSFDLMERFRPLGAVLCAYEIARLVFLAGAFAHLQIGRSAPFPLLALVAPGALFFLMALFLLLDASHYRAYAPLYMAGKGLGVITAAFWIFFADGNMMRDMLFGADRVFALGIALILVLGDPLSAGLASKIMRQ